MDTSEYASTYLGRGAPPTRLRSAALDPGTRARPALRAAAVRARDQALEQPSRRYGERLRVVVDHQHRLAAAVLARVRPRPVTDDSTVVAPGGATGGRPAHQAEALG